jgi:imidazolonepropionase-like amidohydrolase
MLTDGIVRAIVAEAHEHGLRVTAHVGESRGARLAVRAGVDELAHMPCGDDPELMRELADRGLEIVGTLHVVDFVGGCHEVRRNAAAFVRAGGTLLYGSDYGVTGIPGGVVVQELRLLAASGLGRLGALRAATSRAATVLAVDGLGRRAAGSPADVAAVRGDPVRNFATLQDPVLLVRGGRIRLGG